MKIYSRRDVTVDMIQIAGVGDKPRVMYEVIPGDMVTLSFIELNLHEQVHVPMHGVWLTPHWLNLV
jgi:hypothetical protein